MKPAISCVIIMLFVVCLAQGYAVEKRNGKKLLEMHGMLDDIDSEEKRDTEDGQNLDVDTEIKKDDVEYDLSQVVPRDVPNGGDDVENDLPQDVPRDVPRNVPRDVPSGGGSCLSVHNKYRNLHMNTPNLEWDSSLAADAQKWANYLLSIKRMKHSKNWQRPNQGENIAYDKKYPANRSPMTCESAIRAWYDEIEDYDWGHPGSSKNGREILHFTQVVWKKTTRLGMGIAVGRKDGWIYTYIVARYSPKGNMGRAPYYRNNVLPLKTAGPGGSLCFDGHDKCANWASTGECQKNPRWMSNNCKFSCNPTGCNQQQAACKDLIEGCRKHYAAICNGGAYSHYLSRCSATCGKC